MILSLSVLGTELVRVELGEHPVVTDEQPDHILSSRHSGEFGVRPNPSRTVLGSLRTTRGRRQRKNTRLAASAVHRPPA